MGFEKMKPYAKSGYPFVTYTTTGYFVFNSILSARLRDLYGDIYGINILYDRDKNIVRFQFADDGSAMYALHKDKRGQYRVSFRIGISMGFESKRYYSIGFNDDSFDIDMDITREKVGGGNGVKGRKPSNS